MDVLGKQLPFEHHFLSELVGAATGLLGGGKSGGKAGTSVTMRDNGLTGPQFNKVLKNSFASVNHSTTLAVRSSQQALQAVSQQSLLLPLAVLALVGIFIWKGRK